MKRLGSDPSGLLGTATNQTWSCPGGNVCLHPVPMLMTNNDPSSALCKPQSQKAKVRFRRHFGKGLFLVFFFVGENRKGRHWIRETRRTHNYLGRALLSLNHITRPFMLELIPQGAVSWQNYNFTLTVRTFCVSYCLVSYIWEGDDFLSNCLTLHGEHRPLIQLTHA